MSAYPGGLSVPEPVTLRVAALSVDLIVSTNYCSVKCYENEHRYFRHKKAGWLDRPIGYFLAAFRSRESR